MSYQRLTDEHARIDVALAQLTATLDRPDRDSDAAAGALQHLADELESHLAYEDSTLYEALLIDRKPDYAQAVEQFSAQFDALRRDWGVYLDCWGAASIAADWVGFDRATRSMIGRMAERVAAENALLYSSALRFGAIPLRDQRVAAAA